MFSVLKILGRVTVVTTVKVSLASGLTGNWSLTEELVLTLLT